MCLGSPGFHGRRYKIKCGRTSVRTIHKEVSAPATGTKTQPVKLIETISLQGYFSQTVYVYCWKHFVFFLSLFNFGQYLQAYYLATYLSTRTRSRCKFFSFPYNIKQVKTYFLLAYYENSSNKINCLYYQVYQ